MVAHSSRHDDGRGAGDKELVPDPHPHVLLVSSDQLQSWGKVVSDPTGKEGFMVGSGHMRLREKVPCTVSM